MLRLLMVLVVVSSFGVALVGCEEEGSNAAAEFQTQEGRRPKGEKKPPPGPGDGASGFQQGDGNSLPPDQRKTDPNSGGD